MYVLRIKKDTVYNVFADQTAAFNWNVKTAVTLQRHENRASYIDRKEDSGSFWYGLAVRA